jgi:hypothetical protein
MRMTILPLVLLFSITGVLVFVVVLAMNWLERSGVRGDRCTKCGAPRVGHYCPSCGEKALP